MKPSLYVLFLAPAMLLTSCYVTPVAYTPPPPGPSGMHPHSPHSPGGVVVLPREARRISYGGSVYYTHRDVWYRSSGSGYVVVSRPSGYRDSYHGHDRDHDHGRHDRYDRRDNDRFHPRDPRSPGGSVVLPREARRVSYRGQTYYTHRNVWYRPSGSTYVIVNSPY